MYYSFGAHPGFNCKIGDFLEFDNKQACVLNEQIDEESYLMDNQVELLKNEKRITIEKNTFDHDALILSGYTDKVISLKSNNHNRVVRFNFDSPVLGIWAKPNAPYVYNSQHRSSTIIPNKFKIMLFDQFLQFRMTC